MSARRTWLLGGGALLIICASAFYMWIEGVFLPEPEIVMPELPPIKLSAPPATATGTVPANPAPAPVASAPSAATSTGTAAPATATGTSAASPASPTHSVVMAPSTGATQPPPSKTEPPAQPATPTATAPVAATPEPPAPDTRIAELEAIFRPRLESLQTQCEAQLNELADRAIAEFVKLGKTSSAKATVAAKYAPLGRKLQSTCERHYEALITSLETELRMNGLPLTMLYEVKTYYAKRVQEMKVILLKKAGI